MSARRAARAAAAFGCLLIAAHACVPGDGGVPKPVEIGMDAPAYAALSLAGDSVSLAGMRGRVVLLNVWATWCHPCREEIPLLEHIHQQYRSRGLDVVGVTVDAEGAEGVIEEFVQQYRMTYAVWRDPAERISAQFLIVGVPATFLIDRQGVLRYRKIGAFQSGDSTLTGAIEHALAAPPSSLAPQP